MSNNGIIPGDDYGIVHLRAREKFYIDICISSKGQLQRFERMAQRDGQINQREEIMLDIERQGLEMKLKQLNGVRVRIEEYERNEKKTKAARARKIRAEYKVRQQELRRKRGDLKKDNIDAGQLATKILDSAFAIAENTPWVKEDPPKKKRKKKNNNDNLQRDTDDNYKVEVRIDPDNDPVNVRGKRDKQ